MVVNIAPNPNFCLSCGSKLIPDGRYCSCCGSKVYELDKRRKTFPETLVQGRLGEAIVEAVIQYFGYDIVNYGAERTLGTKILRDLRGDLDNMDNEKQRKAPDFTIQNPEQIEEKFELEIKSTPLPLQSWSYDRKRILAAQTHYPESIWIVCSFPHLELYGVKISDLDVDQLTTGQFGKKNINVYESFNSIPEIFSKVDSTELSDLINKIDLRLTELLVPHGQHY